MNLTYVVLPAVRYVVSDDEFQSLLSGVSVSFAALVRDLEKLAVLHGHPDNHEEVHSRIERIKALAYRGVALA